MSKRAVALIVGVLATASIAAGCGGGGDDSSASLTKAELIKKGDSICAKAIKRIKDESAAFLKQSGVGKTEVVSPAQYLHFQTEIFLPGLQREAEEVRALGAPDGEEDEVEEILDAFDQGLEKGEKKPESLPTSSNPLLKPNEMLTEYGFKTCGLN